MSTGTAKTGLVADIGGTHVRFALCDGTGRLDAISMLSLANHDSLDDAVRSYLRACGNTSVRHAVFGIANPVLGDYLHMTNAPWSFSIEGTRSALGLETLQVINDFAALALSLPVLTERDLQKTGGGEALAGAPRGLLGPGTGLGVSALIPAPGGRYVPVAGEGGHVSFAPSDETELALWHAARKEFDHVSMERLLSGSGLRFIFRTLCRRAGSRPADWTAAEISASALDGSCPYSRQALDTFCALLGTAASDLALTLGARGGIYLGGGIIPKLGGYFQTSPFRRRFEDKGRFSSYLAAIPVFLITNPYAALLGAATRIGTPDDTGAPGRANAPSGEKTPPCLPESSNNSPA
jgi:glucokinase